MGSLKRYTEADFVDVVDDGGTVVGRAPKDWADRGLLQPGHKLKSRRGRQADSAKKEPAEFDPAQHSVEEVLEYLADADAAEVERVQAAEAGGKNRSTVAAYETSTEVDEAESDDKTEPDGS